MMKAKMYAFGRDVDVSMYLRRGGGTVDSGIVEFELSDKRTVQLVVYDDGKIMLRGWGNIPILLGNDPSLEVTTQLNYKEITCDEFGNQLDK